MSCVITWNPEDKHSSITLSAADLTATKDPAAHGMVRATDAKNTGKFYFEIYVDLYGGFLGLGIATSSHTLGQRVGYEHSGWSFGKQANKYHGNSYTAINRALSTVCIAQFAVDLDAGKVWFGKDDYWVDGGDPAAGTGQAFLDADIASNYIYPAGGAYNLDTSFSLRACLSDLTYSPPSGFVPWFSPPPAKLSGIIKQEGVGVIRTVRCYTRSTGLLFDNTVSESDGSFELDAPDDTTELYVIALDDALGDQYNALLFDRVVGVMP